MSVSNHTQGVHAGREDLRELGVHALPVDLSTTYPLNDLAEGTSSLEALASGAATAANPVYARLYNPTVARFENALAQLEGAEAAVGFASGMAALSAILLASRERGDEIVAVRPIYGTNDHLLDSGLLGNRVVWTTADRVAEATSERTALVLIETPANPTLELVDIADVVRQAGEVPVVVDSTFATPVLQRPLALGASMVLHSATKFIGGHGDVIAGVVATSESLAAGLRHVRVATGALMHPWAAYLLHRSLPTLKLRVERAQQTALDLAQRLRELPEVRRVFYPGWSSEEQRSLRDRQMAGGGTMLSFELEGGYAAAAQIMRSVALITPAVSLGSVDTLIQHPGALTHHVVDAETRHASGIADSLMRLSVGLEEVEDLWADLAASIRAAHQAPSAPSSADELPPDAFPSAQKSA